MNDQPEMPNVGAMIRTEPIQQRSTARITKLLDTAAQMIDESGIDSLTTSEVAVRSDSSVGVVYRYFPNIQSLLRALAARNLRMFSERVFSTLNGKADDWKSILDDAIDAFVELNRNEPGFRSLRFGSIINNRFIDPSMSNNTVLARAFADILGKKYGFEPDDDLVFNLEVIIEIEDAMLKRAFLLDRNGDERFIQRARDIARQYLNDNTDLPSGA